MENKIQHIMDMVKIVRQEVGDLKSDVKTIDHENEDQDKKLIILEHQVIAILAALSELKDSAKWIRRVVAGAFITGGIGGFVTLLYSFIR